jgi:NAD(P)-dependent dehydrogenase (short-subunit alcohol dehydrogenase family)
MTTPRSRETGAKPKASSAGSGNAGIAGRMRLEGRVALVTGGAGHLGVAVARALADLGAAVGLSDRAGTSISKAAESVGENSGSRIEVFEADLADERAVRDLPRRVVGKLERLDILVNCAGMVGTDASEGWTTPFEQQALIPWELALRVNLTAPFLLSQLAAPYLKASSNGSIVNVGSIYGSVGPDWRMYEGTGSGSPAGYAASKGGLAQLTRWLATTLAPEIRVNAVSPGGIFRGHTEPFLGRYVERTPLRRMGTEIEVAGVVAMLAGDLCSYVTGQNVLVDGGWTAW